MDIVSVRAQEIGPIVGEKKSAQNLEVSRLRWSLLISCDLGQVIEPLATSKFCKRPFRVAFWVGCILGGTCPENVLEQQAQFFPDLFVVTLE